MGTAATPRQLALATLGQWVQLDNPPGVPEREDAGWAGLAVRDRNAAFDLITGVLRRRLLLDALIASQLTMPIEKLDLKVRAILWIGVYQLLFHTSAPAYATVDSSVELAKSEGQTRAAGLINAVLRAITRLTPTLEIRHALSTATFPRDFTHQLRLAKPVFPNPMKDVVAHLAAVTSHPPALIKMLMKAYGEAETTTLLIRNNQRPMILFRADEAGFVPPGEAGLVVHESKGFYAAGAGWNKSIEELVKHGVLSPQDPTSAKPVRALAKFLGNEWKGKQGLSVLDLCAGLGTKTMQLGRAMPEARITATDLDAGKLVRLEERARQLGLQNVSTMALAKIAPGHLLTNPQYKIEKRFDVVMLDVPCSNTGVMARRVQSRWRWPSLDHGVLAKIQLDLLRQAQRLLNASPGPGVILYSTCSIDPSENQQRVQAFLAELKGKDTLALKDEELTLPFAGDAPAEQGDGGYFAVLSRR